ncbi:hypothetical protein KIPB_002001 [Kipferlia bialata]|uniref:Uncharacterized protein n=1 Tax=Kipferlia bialata TaxID=797122 RepID=A0A9K3CR54_9EUKA|nr:hypothetical protein KIPB_002001 [Kipferlia bialata]|eukprot:g2001.t1
MKQYIVYCCCICLCILSLQRGEPELCLQCGRDTLVLVEMSDGTSQCPRCFRTGFLSPPGANPSKPGQAVPLSLSGAECSVRTPEGDVVDISDLIGGEEALDTTPTDAPAASSTKDDAPIKGAGGAVSERERVRSVQEMADTYARQTQTEGLLSLLSLLSPALSSAHVSMPHTVHGGDRVPMEVEVVPRDGLGRSVRIGTDAICKECTLTLSCISDDECMPPTPLPLSLSASGDRLVTSFGTLEAEGGVSTGTGEDVCVPPGVYGLRLYWRGMVHTESVTVRPKEEERERVVYVDRVKVLDPSVVVEVPATESVESVESVEAPSPVTEEAVVEETVPTLEAVSVSPSPSPAPSPIEEEREEVEEPAPIAAAPAPSKPLLSLSVPPFAVVDRDVDITVTRERGDASNMVGQLTVRVGEVADGAGEGVALEALACVTEGTTDTVRYSFTSKTPGDYVVSVQGATLGVDTVQRRVLVRPFLFADGTASVSLSASLSTPPLSPFPSVGRVAAKLSVSGCARIGYEVEGETDASRVVLVGEGEHTMLYDGGRGRAALRGPSGQYVIPPCKLVGSVRPVVQAGEAEGKVVIV